MLIGLRSSLRGVMWTRLINTLAAMKTAVQVAYTAVGLSVYNSPPIDGPQMTAVCCAVAEAAMARGRSVIGTIPGTSAWMVGISKARAVPDTNRMASITSRLSEPRAVPTASASAASALAT